MTPQTQIIFGPPGTGKTTYLMNTVEKEIESGVNPNQIAYVSFTKQATGEAINRAIDKFNFKKDDLPYFRTLHSLAYRTLGIGYNQMLTPRLYKTFGQTLGVEISGYYEMSENAGSKEGDKMMFIYSFAQNRCIELRKAWEMFHDMIPWYELKQFVDTLEQYKKESSLMDYNDLILEFNQSKKPANVKVAIIDEAQDLTTLQWKMVFNAFSECERIYIAGDDDQSIYKWSGADVDLLLNLKGEKIVLNKSYRLPQKIFDSANSLTKRISHRQSKKWTHNGEQGEVNYIYDLDSIDLTSGEWLLMVRNSYLIDHLVSLARYEGVPYSTKKGSSISEDHIIAIKAWETLRKQKTIDGVYVKNIYEYFREGHEIKRGMKRKVNGLKAGDIINMNDLKLNFGLLTDKIWHESCNGITPRDREYYLAILKRGEKITDKPRIHISTIHGAKGGEADNVLLIPDMSYRTHQNYETSPDDEHRCFYVGKTRAKKALNIMNPQGIYYYNM